MSKLRNIIFADLNTQNEFEFWKQFEEVRNNTFIVESVNDNVITEYEDWIDKDTTIYYKDKNQNKWLEKYFYSLEDSSPSKIVFKDKFGYSPIIFDKDKKIIEIPHYEN